MSKHRQRVQLRRKRGAANSEKSGYGAGLIEIYSRATQGGSDAYLTINQESEPERVERILAQAQMRRDRRGTKERVLRVGKAIPAAGGHVPASYRQLPVVKSSATPDLCGK